MSTRLMWVAVLAMFLAPAALAAEVAEYRKVDVFIADEKGDEKKKDARLEIDTEASEIRLVDERRGAERATYAVIPIDKVTGLAYEPEAGGKPWGGVVTITPDTHWLTIRSDELPTGSMKLRLDKSNQLEVRQALREVTGLIDDVGLGLQ